MYEGEIIITLDQRVLMLQISVTHNGTMHWIYFLLLLLVLWNTLNHQAPLLGFLPRKLIPSIEAFKVEIWRTTPSFRNAWAQKFRSRWNVKVEIQIEKNCFIGSIASLEQQYLNLLLTLHCHCLFTHCMHCKALDIQKSI